MHMRMLAFSLHGSKVDEIGDLLPWGSSFWFGFRCWGLTL